MGYSTKYTLTVFNRASVDITSHFESETHDNINAQETLDCMGVELGVQSDGIKWYEHDQDMCALSKDYPDYIFQLDGVGEEFPDIWRKFYKDGKTVHYKAKIILADIDDLNIKDLN